MNIQDIVDKLIQYKKSYYNDVSEVSDEDFDKLEDQLRELDPTNDYFSVVGSPVDDDNKNKRTHKIPMGSQSKVKINDGGIDYVIDNFINTCDTIVSYKMDGISVAIDYSNGVLQFATSRGDGFIGTDLPNPSEFVNVPVSVSETCDFTARGELVITYDDFITINAQLSDDDKFSNPRNAVSGIAQKEDSPFRKYITVYYYDAVGDFVCDYKTQVFEFLVNVFCIDSNGDIGSDAVVPYYNNMSPDEFRELAEDLDKNRKSLPYMIDGLVIEFDNLEYYKSLGIANGNKPKGSVAFKMNPIAEETTVTGVVWQVGSTGDLTPVVEFEPTLIDGSIVSRASIHNYTIFKEWGFCVGDVIKVQKNNDIIPQVKEIVGTFPGSVMCEAPTECPDCGSTLEHITVAKTENLTCTNPVCGAKRVGAIKKWCTKAGMNTKGVGDAFFESYVDYCETQDDGFNISTVYCLTVEDIMKISSRYKDKSATKIYNAIQSSKTMKLMDVFGGLNIHGCGSRTFKKIIEASGVTTIVGVYDYCRQNDLTKIDGIGDVTAKAIVSGLPECHGDMVFMTSEIEIIQEATISADAQTYLFTGTFVTIDPDTGKGYKRKALEALVSSKGHIPASAVNKKLNYLVTSDPESTKGKMKKARDMGIPIIGEDEFFGMMG